MAERKALRCAVYTRKSTEYGLEQDFNSLDAQRESCEAYIKSQSHEGWKLIPKHYDDGGISGATLERPALQDLLTEVKAGKVDTIVVYKVDRLTRSLADFAKLVELFDGHGVSFVSVTQQFNTTTSMGRLTLNVLLSFAQFEREVTAERIRDKIAASKQRGLWVGGPPPLGYVIRDKKLVIDEKEATQVRLIFDQYLKLSGLSELMVDLEKRRIVTKVRKLKTGKTVGGISFYKGPLAYLLKNRLYIGDVSHRGKIYKGQQAPIIDRNIFDAVQQKLSKAPSSANRTRATTDALLQGKIFDDAGNRMSPTRTQKGSVRYRFYISAPWKGKAAISAASKSRISAPGLERDVLDALRDRYPENSQVSDHEVIEQLAEKIVVSRDKICIFIRPDKVKDDQEDGPVVVPLNDQRRQTRREIISSGEQVNDPSIGLRSENHKILVTAIAKGRRWAEELLGGDISSANEIADREKCSERYVRDVLGLAYLAPDIVSAAIENRLPPHLIVTKLRADVPLSWAEQRRRFHLS